MQSKYRLYSSTFLRNIIARENLRNAERSWKQFLLLECHTAAVSVSPLHNVGQVQLAEVKDVFFFAIVPQW